MNSATQPAARIIVGLDFPDAASALALVDRLDPAACGVKIGKELFTSAGPDVVRACVARGFRVFLDLKFHDIPNTVGQACAAAARLGVWMLNVHASGGPAMLDAARQGVDRTARELGKRVPLLIGVTVLTSLSDDDLAKVGVRDSAEAQALRLARLVQAHGLDGVVCSPREVPALRAATGAGFVLVTPGIRMGDAKVDDQTRIATPESAVRSGADYLVVGRPITQAPDAQVALRAIRSRIGEIA
jgi:orotidine-5'-phosphate decarboxylase